MRKPKAVGSYVWVIRDDAESEIGGLYIPDSNKVKPNKGKIFSVGVMSVDNSIKPGRTAIFNKNVGQEIEYEGITYTILRSENEILGTDD